MSRSQTFASESRATLKLAVPIMAGQVSQMAMGLIDSAMVGRVGVLQLAAAAFANNVVSVPFVFGIGILTCISVRTSQSHGAGDAAESGEVLRHGMVLTAVISLLMTAVVGLIGANLDKFGQPADVAVEARNFLLLLGLSIIPGLLAVSLKQFCEALSNPWPSTLILLAGVPLNIFLNWVFIYGNLGFSPLGLEGAGIATLIARVFSLLGLAIYVGRATQIRPSLPKRWRAKFDGAQFISLLRIGIPASVQILLEIGAFAVGAIFVGWIGKEALAAHQIAFTCAGMTFMLALGLAIATSIRIGQAVGSGDFARVRAIGFTSMVLTFGAMGLTALLFLFFADAIAGVFVTDTRVAHIAAQLLLIAAVFQLFDGLQGVSAGALRGLSDVMVPMVIYLVSYWVIGMPLGYFAAFSLGWGVIGIWSGFALSLFCIATLLLWRFVVKSRPISGIESDLNSQIPTLSVH